MYEYSHGGNAVFENGNENIIDLSVNINPLGMPENVRNAIISEIQNCSRYPDNFSTRLREKIANFENVKIDWVFCGNGTSDIIFRLPKTIKTKKSMIAAPTFQDYERSAISSDFEIVRYKLNPESRFALDSGFIEAVWREKPGLIFICNPNNPTGNVTETGLIGELLDACMQTGVLVVVDECFLDFVEHANKYTSKIFLEEYSNLVILKAFTKLFALPGIRLGYALCADRTRIDSLNFHGADWPVSNLAQVAGIAALEDAENYVKKTIAYTASERITIEKELERLGYNIYEARANFVFLQNPYPFDLCAELDKKGIRIRSCGNYPGLDGSYYRIAVSKKVYNARLLSAAAELSKPYIRFQIGRKRSSC
jgi:threonine-phosphate decarboxylase